MAHEQMREFLRFFASKRDVQVTELDAMFEEFQEARVVDDIIARDDLLPMLDSLLMEVKDSVKGALAQTAQMSGLVVEQVLRDGRDKGVTLAFDMSKTEDESLLAEVGKMRLDDSVSKEPEIKPSGFKLDSIRDEHQRLVQESERLAQENASLKERCQQVMRQATQALGEKNDLGRRLREAEAKLESAGEGAAKASGEMGAAVESARSELAAAKAENNELEDQVAQLSMQLSQAQERLAKLGDTTAPEPVKPGNFKTSKQFNQLKGLLAKKNQQLTELRTRLAKYEPDNVRDADADSASHK